MKVLTIRNVDKVGTYINEDSKELEITVKYEGSCFAMHTTNHVNLFFDQFKDDSEGLYWLAKDSRVHNIGKHMIRNDAKKMFNDIIESYPEFLKNTTNDNIE